MRSVLGYFVYLVSALVFPPQRNFEMSYALGFGD